MEIRSAPPVSRFARFVDFYPFYLSQHSNRTCRRLHFAGTTLGLALLGVAGQAVAALLSTFDVPQIAATVASVFRIVSAVALIRICGFAAFRLLLPFMGRSPPRIVEDVAIVVVYVIYAFTQLRAIGVDLGSIVTTSAILTA